MLQVAFVETSKRYVIILVLFEINEANKDPTETKKQMSKRAREKKRGTQGRG